MPRLSRKEGGSPLRPHRALPSGRSPVRCPGNVTAMNGDPPLQSPPALGEPKGSGRRLSPGFSIVVCLAAVKLAIHLTFAGAYGLFTDELYFLACGEHLDWGYVDMPPLTGLQTFLARHLFGDSLLAIRLFPAVAGAGIVLMAGLLAREF